MGTLQSITNVNCYSSKREDELSDDERAESETKESSAACVAHPWHHGPGTAASNAPVAMPRSVSSATTVPTHLQK